MCFILKKIAVNLKGKGIYYDNTVYIILILTSIVIILITLFKFILGDEP